MSDGLRGSGRVNRLTMHPGSRGDMTTKRRPIHRRRTPLAGNRGAVGGSGVSRTGAPDMTRLAAALVAALARALTRSGLRRWE
jgi:hypothetical protein